MYQWKHRGRSGKMQIFQDITFCKLTTRNTRAYLCGNVNKITPHCLKPAKYWSRAPITCMWTALWLSITSVSLKHCSAVHSALLVGLLRANMIGLSLKDAMSLIIFSVKAPATAATPSCSGNRAEGRSSRVYKQILHWDHVSQIKCQSPN